MVESTGNPTKEEFGQEKIVEDEESRKSKRETRTQAGGIWRKCSNM